MRQRYALAVTALVATGGLALLGPPALPPLAAGMSAMAPMPADLHLASARAALQDAPDRSDRVAAGHALRALVAMPLDQEALSLLIESGATGDPVAALNLAAALGWRDALVNARLAGLALESGDSAIAAQRIDALGRTMGGQRVAPAADLLMAQPGGPGAFAVRAAHRTGGEWWLVYLARPAASADAMSGRLEFARMLDARDGRWRRNMLLAAAHGLGLTDLDAPVRERFEQQLHELRQ